jgi:hypothetical protein
VGGRESRKFGLQAFQCPRQEVGCDVRIHGIYLTEQNTGLRGRAEWPSFVVKSIQKLRIFSCGVGKVC